MSTKWPCSFVVAGACSFSAGPRAVAGRGSGTSPATKWITRKSRPCSENCEIACSRKTGVDAVPDTHQNRIKHGVTRFRITLDCYTARFVESKRAPAKAPELKWVTSRQLAEYPLNTTGRKLARLVQ